ncbi:MAG: pilus assembly protein TadG-related protein [Candidatus Igneacidithiobacillus chanchocoensis]
MEGNILVSKRSCARSPANWETGQAALAAVLLIPVVIAGVLLVFNTGQVTASKLRVQNAADAAAFSAMELQARQMNLDAYLNRAMLTNQIAIGQAVSILSWSRYVGKVGENIHYPFDKLRSIASAIPYAGGALVAFLNTYQKAIEANAKTIAIAGGGYGQNFMVDANTYDAIYAGASSAFNLSLGVSTPKGAVQQTVLQVVKLNAGPNARVLNYDSAAGFAALVAPYSSARRNYVTTWGGSADGGSNDPGGRARMASMINEGAQSFVTNRAHGVDSPLTFTAPPFARANTTKVGGSQFTRSAQGRYVWSSADTVRTTFQLRKHVLFGGWQTVFSDTWGWGGAWSAGKPDLFDYYRYGNRNWSYPYMDAHTDAAKKTLLNGGGQVYQGAWSQDARGMSKVVRDFSDPLVADKMPLPGLGRGAEMGIARYRDLRWTSNDPNGRPRADLTDSAPRYVVVVDLPRAKVRDSATALGISHDPDATNSRLGWLNMHLQTNGAGRNEGVRAAAAAQVYFRRPAELWPRSDGLDERANLFSPFWTARLVDLSAQERAAVAALTAAE